jgi:hypothetical protein
VVRVLDDPWRLAAAAAVLVPMRNTDATKRWIVNEM